MKCQTEKHKYIQLYLYEESKKQINNKAESHQYESKHVVSRGEEIGHERNRGGRLRSTNFQLQNRCHRYEMCGEYSKKLSNISVWWQMATKFFTVIILKMWLKHFLYPSWVPFSSILPSPVMSTTLNFIVNISMHSIYVLLLFNRTTMFCCCSVAKLCPTPCNPRDCSMPGFPVLYSLPEFAQIHVHWVDDAIQPSHPLSSLEPF